MSVTFAAGFVQLIFLLGLGGGFGLPLGIPPGPEDPALAKAAPEECLFYAAWAGTAKPNAQSKNQTERLLAEPEIQRFAGELTRLVKSRLPDFTWARPPRGNPSAALAVKELADLAETVLGRPGAVFLTSVRPDPRTPDVRGGALFNLGDQADRVKQVLEKLQASQLGGRAESVEIGGVTWHRIALGRGAPPLAWGIHGKHLIAAVGEGEAEALLKRIEGSPPQWLTSVHKQLPVPRPATLTYVNAQAIVELVKPLVPSAQGRAAIDVLGLDGVTHFAAVTGLDETGFVNRSLVGLSEGAGGIFKIVSDKPLTAEDLAPLPHDATIAAAARFDVDRAWEMSLDILEKLDPATSGRFRTALESAQNGLELNLRDDLLKPLGDVWCVYNSPGEGGLVLTGLTAVVRVKDAQRLAKGHAQLLRVAKNLIAEQSGPPHRRTEITEFDHAGHKVYYLKTPGNELPIAPAWCLTDKELIVALFPQNVKAYLSRGKGFVSLAKRPEVAQALASKPGPMKLVYQDTPELFRLGYPLLQIGAKYAVGQLRRGGIDVDLAILPSAAAITKHLRPGTIAVTRTAAGIEIVSKQTLPTGNVGASVPVGVALLLPAVQSAREAARRSQSMNNLKQIGLAMHNHHDVYKTFPAAHSTDKEGKPLLSWRVHILPFVEQLPLYREFHLDEPWDSDHNKKLIAQMPPVYRSPNSRAAPGRTNYVTVRGERTIFPGKRAIGMRDITDGTSNTILAVEANDDSAVEWTKPDDFVFDPKNPTKGLLGLRPGGFNILMADGSVRFLNDGVDADVLRALFTRDGGEVVSPDGLRQVPRRLAPVTPADARPVPELPERPQSPKPLRKLSPPSTSSWNPLERARTAARRAQSTNNLKQLALALHNYADTYRQFPPAFTTDKEGKPALSWRVLVLPYLEQEPLFKEFRLDEPWDSDHNKRLVERTPAVFRAPQSKADKNKTNYLTIRGERTVFSGKRPARFSDILDGTSNTLMTVEVSDELAVVWTKPDDFVPDAEEPLKGLVGLQPDGFLAGMTDGSVHYLSSKIDAQTLRCLFDRADGQAVDPGRWMLPGR